MKGEEKASRFAGHVIRYVLREVGRMVVSSFK